MLISSSSRTSVDVRENHFVLVETHHSVRWSFEHSPLLYEFDRSHLREFAFVVEFTRAVVFDNLRSNDRKFDEYTIELQHVPYCVSIYLYLKSRD